MIKRNKIAVIIFSTFVFIILAIIGVFLYFQGLYFPLFNKVIDLPIIEQSSDKIIMAMQENMSQINTAHYELASSIVLLSGDTPFSIDSDIFYDGGYEERLRGNLSIKNSIQVQNLSFLANLEMRLAGEKEYFKITEVPAIPFLSLAKIKNQWYEYIPDLEKASSRYTGNLIKAALQRVPFFKVEERLPDEIFNGKLSYHYKVKLNNEGAKMLIGLLPEILDKQIDFSLANIQNLPIDIWIGKNDKYLYRLEIELNDEAWAGNINIHISHFNESVSIDVPSKTKPANEFAQVLFGQTNFLDLPLFGYLAGLDTQNLIEDNDKDGLYNMWESLFKTDPKKADTDGDNFSDIYELRNGYNPAGAGKLFE